MANTYTWTFPRVEYVASSNGVTNSIKRIPYRIDVTNSSDAADAYVWHLMGIAEVTDDSLSFDTATVANLKTAVLSWLSMTEAQVETKLDGLRTASYLDGEIT
jgi:hypothetical protein